MATLVGVAVDVSDSMQSSALYSGNQQGGSWARSIFNVVDGLIKHDVSSSNHVFALGFGGSSEPVAFDLLNTIKKASSKSSSLDLSKTEILKQILRILESNGAPRVRKWAKMNVLDEVVEHSDASLILDTLKDDSSFRNRFVNECLPESCRRLEHSVSSYATEGLFSAAGMLGLDKMQDDATKESVQDVITKGLKLLPTPTCVSIGPNAIMDVHTASKILHGCIGQADLTDKRVDELMKTVEGFIYGGTPLMETLSEAKKIFAMSKFKHYNKLLFILSDGQPTDGNDPPIRELSALGVTTVCCYITDSAIDDPKRLYSTECASWDASAKLMFRMSSTIETQLVPRTIFLKRGWTIDITNNETRLFVHVNHPDTIEDVCDLARDVVCCQDALSDVLTSVSLDLYINQANLGFQPQQQQGGTCYANASAAVMHLSMKRIVGRDGGCPDFFTLRDKIIKKYGEKGANTLKVLKDICPQYRLHCDEVNVIGAMKAITSKRPVIANFRLTDAEWTTFKQFYRNNPRGILTRSDLDIKRRHHGSDLFGHAVVLTGFNSEGLRLMNSWGSDWADAGFFKINNADVLGMEFVDVLWTEKDLKPSEIEDYNRHGASIAQQLITRLKGLRTAQCKCPLCGMNSGLDSFSGHHLEAECPICKGKFSTKDAGDDLALNMYLLSLSCTSTRAR